MSKLQPQGFNLVLTLGGPGVKNLVKIPGILGLRPRLYSVAASPLKRPTALELFQYLNGSLWMSDVNVPDVHQIK